MKDVELLAPVGSFESLKAAVQNGANAVYLGGKEFSARASANNFDKDELKEAVKYAHIRGVRVFVTTNTLIKQNELEGFIEYVKFLYDINIDALILQDIGAAMTIKKLLPDFELHASTQMVAHSLEDVKYLESVGFDRVVLAREVTVEEINSAFINNASETLVTTTDPIVSSDVIGTTCGALADLSLTKVVEHDGKQMVKVISWYDNEMGYSAQMVRTAKKLLSL